MSDNNDILINLTDVSVGYMTPTMFIGIHNETIRNVVKQNTTLKAKCDKYEAALYECSVTESAERIQDIAQQALANEQEKG